MLISCVSLRDAENYTACGLESVRDRYKYVMDILEAQLISAREGFAEFKSEATEFAENVAAACQNMQNFFVSKIMNVAREILEEACDNCYLFLDINQQSLERIRILNIISLN